MYRIFGRLLQVFGVRCVAVAQPHDLRSMRCGGELRIRHAQKKENSKKWDKKKIGRQ